MLNQFSIKTRIALGFSIVLLLLVNAAYVGWSTTVGQQEGIRQILDEEVTSAKYASYMNRDALQLRRFEKDTFLNLQNKEKIEEYRVKWNEANKRFDDDLQKSLVLASNEEKQALEAIKKNMEAYRAGFEKISATVRSGGFGSAQDANKAMSEFKQPIRDMEEQLDKYIDLQFAHEQKKRDELAVAAKSASAWLLGVGIGATLLGIIVALVITGSIIGPVGRLQNTITQIDRTSDLSLRVADRGSDEISHVGKVFNRLLENMRSLIGNTQTQSIDLNQTAEQLAIIGHEIQIAAQEQYESVSSSAAAIDELTKSISFIADHVRIIEDEAESARDLANNGNEIARNAEQEIKNIARVITESSDAVTGLSQRSGEIGGIVNVIKEIADQTNLLALNAAIEAARAGETGRGFAVVADEVRKLAERTSAATAEISKLIGMVQGETQAAVSSMRSANGTMALGVDLTQKVASALAQIRQVATASAKTISEIASAIEEQNQASSRISQNIERSAQAAEETSRVITQTNEISSHLRAATQDMQGLISKYRI